MGCKIVREEIPELSKYPIYEVRKHNDQNDCWIIVGKYVYDVTTFLDRHPGSKKAILRHAGDICDHHFEFHSQKARDMLMEYKIGKIKKINPYNK